MLKLLTCSQTRWYNTFKSKNPRHLAHIQHLDERVKQNRTWFYQKYNIGGNLTLPSPLVRFHHYPEIFRKKSRPGFIFTTNVESQCYYTQHVFLEKPIYSMDTCTLILEFQTWSEFQQYGIATLSH